MGYRHYMYKVNKKDVEEIKNMNFGDLVIKYRSEVEDGYLSMHSILNQEVIHEFGKLYWCDTSERIYNAGVPLFNDNKVMEEFIDYVPFIVGKNGLETAIQCYKEKIIKNLENTKETEECKAYISDRLTEWKAFKMSEKLLTSSWTYEFMIFDLMYLLKTIDFETETILFYGW